jgi:hypothetical protein
MKSITVNCGGVRYGTGGATEFSQYIQPSRYFGWQIACSKPPISTPTYQCSTGDSSGNLLDVTGIRLELQELSGPALDATGNNLWYQGSNWVRGSWPVDLAASDPSGVCTMSIIVNGHEVNSYVDWLPDTSQWTQCPGSNIPGTVDTTGYPNGAGTLSLTFSASNAAGVSSASSHAFDVDNAAPTTALSGRTDALVTAGTQYVTATAAAGPSGVRAIDCSVDGGAEQQYLSASAQIPVSGVGSHIVRCYSQNNAIDVSGQYATSGTASYALTIRQPTAAAITFSRIADALRCTRHKERVKGPVRIVRRHGRRVQVRGRSRTVTVTRCRARTVRRKVRVVVVRHGRRVRVTRWERVVELPHLVSQPTLRVGHGHGTTISGWLGLADGTALPGRPVQILAAPNNGLNQFSAVSTVQTNASGLWSSTIAPGPSRLIESFYAGDASTESDTSAAITLTVPARIGLVSVTPRRIAWGGRVRIRGDLVGGYLPAGGVLLRLRIGLGRAVTTYGVHEHVGGSGTFSTTYTFGIGDPRVHRAFWFQVATLPMGNYPYAPANSNKRTVLVGGHPRSTARHTRKKRRRRRHRA